MGRHLSNQLLVFRRKIDEFGVDEGQEMTVHVDIESREYNSRWYIDVKASRVETADAGGPPPTEENPPPPSEAPPSDFDDDIPF